MIEAQTSREATEVLLFRWFRTHARLASSSGSEDGPKVELAEPKAKRKFIPSLPILELQPAVQPQAPDVVHPHILPNANSFHLADYIDKSWSEIIYPNQREGPSPTPRSDTSSIKTELSHPRLSLDISEPTLLRPFERISGRRTIPHVQSDPGQVSHTSEERTPFSLLEVISLESLTREFDLGLLSAFPAPPKPAPVRPPSLLKKLGIKSPFSWPSLSPTPDSTPSSPQALRTRLERGNESHSSLSRSTPGSAHELERDSSMYYGSSSQSSNTTSVIVDSHDRSPSPDLPPRSSLIPSVSSRWNFLTKSKQKPKARKVSALFASSKSPAPSHGKENVFPKNLSHRVFGNG
ncbi:hypothetical protein BJ322DRAFT_741324 [Thelephora terrestris]|uniref:Uncharacterized protein n=1 Tax=Thelephora terrestris TaxID=56493 RepID=A0A9P6HET8_9AGAM|nr:hypothetical protein BJ322DRAFT_741324 [Thelephora terrestris]